MSRSTLIAVLAGPMMVVGGCAADTATGLSGVNSSQFAAITIAQEPCFGFCPVYDVTVGSDGAVSFDGKRHTAVVGQRSRRAGPSTYKAIARSLAAFRPTGDQEVAIPPPWG